MTHTLKHINPVIESRSLLFCLLAAVILLATAHIDSRTRRYFLGIFLFLFFARLAYMGGLFLHGRSDAVGRALLRIAHVTAYFRDAALMLVLTLYLLYLIRNGEQRSARIWYRAAGGIFAIAVLLLAISQFAGGIYHRGLLFWLSQALAIGALLLDAALVIRYRHRLSRIERLGFCIYIGAALLVILLQLFFCGSCFFPLVSALAAVFLLGANQREQYYRAERELVHMRAAITLSQMKPHFLYNSLTAIAQLCEQSPAEAKKATIAFAEYLRANMQLWSSKGVVSFETEMQCIRGYLYLEQLRFGEELSVEMDIATTDFYLPAFTIQPLVENAIKWGVGQTEGGGTVTLATRKTPLGTEITITDDGAGFDTEQQPQDGREHFGLQLVRDRLCMVRGAMLTVESKIGQGTVARVFLPDKHEESKGRRRKSQNENADCR